MSHPSAPNLLGYDSGREATSLLVWRVTLGLAVAYLVLLGALLAGDVWPMRFSLALVGHPAAWEPRNTPLALVHAVPPALACTNVLAVAGYALGVAGRSPRRPLLVYAAVQGSLLALVLAAAGYAAWCGQFSFSTTGRAGSTSGYTVFVAPRAFAVAAAASLLLSLPLLPMLLPRARRVLLRPGAAAARRASRPSR